jgi:ABC-type transporter Mla MlaB component
MLSISQVNNNSYKFSFNEIIFIDRAIGDELVFEVVKRITTNGNLLIDLDGIKEIDSNGFKALFEITSIASNRYCQVSFTNVNDEISEMINNLTYTSDG